MSDLNTNSAPQPRSRSKRGHPRALGRLERAIVHMVARELGVSKQGILQATRSSNAVAHARQLAMYLLHVGTSRKMEDVAAVFGRHRTTVAHACGRVEDRRDCPRFDAFVCRLEEALEEFDESRRDTVEEAVHVWH